MRRIDKIIIHSSATPPDMDIGVPEIDKWHKDRGFSQIGYHFVIRRDGVIERGRPVCVSGAHARGHNLHSIGICWIGGYDTDFNTADNRTDEQKTTMIMLIKSLLVVFPISDVFGHRNVKNTKCPSFDAKKEFEKINSDVFN